MRRVHHTQERKAWIMSYPHLSSPIMLGDLDVPNRTALAPMGVRLDSPDENWPQRQIRYFEERAIGETGLIITTFCRVHGSLASFHHVAIYDDRFIPGHKKLVDRIHAYDTKIFLQIALSGGKRAGEAPSSIYSPNYHQKPRALTTGEVEELVESFIRAAERAREAGYDGVEVHGAHSYLIGQMMSPSLNRRTDAYGGSFEGRMKFPTDVIRGIRERCPGFPVGFKFSAHEELPGGVDLELAKGIASHIAELGVVYLHVASTASTIEVMSDFPSVPPLYIPRNTLVPLAAEIKKTVPDVPVMATGSITVPEEADRFIANGDCDMVALGRTLFADPHWMRKARRGERVVPCIRCNVCYHQLWFNRPVWCSVNPYLLHEAEQKLPPAAERKRVLIVGAGPAGIRCALTASKRGHEVILCEKRDTVGGMVQPGSRPDCKRDVALLQRWYEAELADSDVDLRLETEVDAAMVAEIAPDALVLAVGGEPVVPDVPGIDMPHAVSAIDVLRDVDAYRGSKAVVIGGGEVGCETACHLADNGRRVTIVEKLPELMAENPMKNVTCQMLALIERKGIGVMTSTSLSAITGEGVEVTLPNGKAWGIEADLAVYAVGMKGAETFEAPGTMMQITPAAGPVAEMAMNADEVYVIGDCARPGRIRAATEDGERIGRWL